MERFERIGYQIMHRSGGGMMDGNPLRRAVGPAQAPARRPAPRPGVPRRLPDRAAANKEGTDYVADAHRRRELYGEEVTDLLDDARLRKPEIDVLDEAPWPTI